MGGNISVQASGAMQNAGTSNDRVQSLTLQRDQLENQIERIKNNKLLSDKEKEKRAQNLETRLANLDVRIQQAEKKQVKEEQKKKLEEQKDTLELTMDGETAQTMLRLQQLTKMVLSADSNLDSGLSSGEESEMIAEITNEVATEDVDKIDADNLSVEDQTEVMNKVAMAKKQEDEE